MNSDSLLNRVPVKVTVLVVLMIGIVLGLIASRSSVVLQNQAQTVPQPTLATGEACRFEQAICSVDPNDLPANSRFRLRILAGGTPVITGLINQPTLAVAQVQENTQYKCEIEVLNVEGTPYPEQQCIKTIDATYSCSNCSCKDWGTMVFKPEQKRVGDPAKYFKAEWRGATPPPQCPDDSQNCNEVRVFAENPNEPKYDNYISKYSCTQNPVPTIRLHQALGTGTRKYKAVPFNKAGDPLQACVVEQPFSCADIGGCSLKEINFKATYVERMDTGKERTVIVKGSDCTKQCNFSLNQNGNEIEENATTCVQLNNPLDISYQSAVSGPKITYDDDRIGNIWTRLANKLGKTQYTYQDAGIYEIKLNCDPNAGNVSSEFYCVKRLVIGCEGGGGSITPSASPSPSPTPASCPIPKITMVLPSCTECSLTPSP